MAETKVACLRYSFGLAGRHTEAQTWSRENGNRECKLRRERMACWFSFLSHCTLESLRFVAGKANVIDIRMVASGALLKA